MVGFKCDLDLFELLGRIPRRSAQGRAGDVCEHLLPGVAADVDARAGLLPDVGEGLLHGSTLARVGDVEPRLPVQIVSCGFEGKDPPLVSDAAHDDPQTHAVERCFAVERGAARQLIDLGLDDPPTECC